MKKDVRFGSLLKDDPRVLLASQRYPAIRTKYWWNDKTPYRPLPTSFDGRDKWKAYTQFSDNQTCADSWAIVATDVLADRYAILSVAQMNLFLTAKEIVTCMDTPPLSPLPGVLSDARNDSSANTSSANTSSACDGYSIYSAWEYLYQHGVAETTCFSAEKLNINHLPLPDKLSFDEKESVYGKNCSKISCLKQINGKPVARRAFYINAIFNVYDTDEHGVFDSNKTIETIKYELLRFGPMAAGFLVYENFANDYDGKSIYTSVSGRPLGGHYVTIMGWGVENGIEYWLCRNSWGADWGLIGFFKIKIGIPECMLEQNVSACDPYFHDSAFNLKANFGAERIDAAHLGQQVVSINMSQFNPILAASRELVHIDPFTFYPLDTLRMINEGKVYGDVEPLIQHPSDLPDRNYYWAENFISFTYLAERPQLALVQESVSMTTYILFIVFLFFVIGWKVVSKNE